ncbi:MAG: diguanylate cyclase [Methylobacterium sp.]|nr:diguanylate cyclase [Methylobacterium sp.]
MCRTAKALFDVPIALISIVESDRQWFKAKCGISVDGTSRGVSFCTYAIMDDTPFIVEDATRDLRFCDNPLVTGPPGIRFYAGAPLIIGPGLRVGTLCIIDSVPRSFDEEQRHHLQDLALMVVAQLRQAKIEADLRDSEARFRILADNASDMVIRSALDTTRRYVSPAALAITGYTPEELVGTRPLDFVHPDDSEAYGRVLDEVCKGTVRQAVSRQRYRRKDGSWTWVEATFSLTHDPKTGVADGYVAAVRDVNERMVAERRIAHMARHDALTDLANRTLFQERLSQEIARARRYGGQFAVLCMDLDRFKAVNDTLGHQAGDSVLKTIAERMRHLIRTEDILARFGGDEFMILLTGGNQPDSAGTLSQRLIKAVREPIDIDGVMVTVGLSIGISFGPQSGLDADGLYRQADLALYRSKAEGRNTYRFHDSCEPAEDAAPVLAESA